MDMNYMDADLNDVLAAYGYTPTAVSGTSFEQEVDEEPAANSDGPIRLACMSIINYLEGYKVRLRELHWSAGRMSDHKLSEDLIGLLDEYEDNIAEDMMGQGERAIQTGEVNPVITKQLEISELIKELVIVCKSFRDNLVVLAEEMDYRVFDGLISLTDDFIHDLYVKKYLTRLA